MKLTNQQSLVLFDIAKSAMNYSERGFGGYSKETIMNLINNIISQQDNKELYEGIDIEDVKNEDNVIDVPKSEEIELEKDINKSSSVDDETDDDDPDDNFWI